MTRKHFSNKKLHEWGAFLPLKLLGYFEYTIAPADDCPLLMLKLPSAPLMFEMHCILTNTHSGWIVSTVRPSLTLHCFKWMNLKNIRHVCVDHQPTHTCTLLIKNWWPDAWRQTAANTRLCGLHGNLIWARFNYLITTPQTIIKTNCACRQVTGVTSPAFEVQTPPPLHPSSAHCSSVLWIGWIDPYTN